MSKGAVIGGVIAGFVLGATAGAIGAGCYFKRKYKAIADEEVKSVVEAFSHAEECEKATDETVNPMTVEQAFKKASAAAGSHSVSSIQNMDDGNLVEERAEASLKYNSKAVDPMTPSIDNPNANVVEGVNLDDVPDATETHVEDGCEPFEIQPIDYMEYDDYEAKEYLFFPDDNTFCDEDGFKISTEEVRIYFGPNIIERVKTGNGWTHIRNPKMKYDYRIERMEGSYNDSQFWREEAWSVR